MQDPQRLRRRAFTILATVCFVALSGHPCFADEKTDAKARIKALRQDRLVAAREVHELTLKAYQQGGTTFEQVRQAKMTLLHAQLELCETNAERLKVYEEMVKQAREWEQSVLMMFKMGGVSRIEILKAKIHRLEIEIALEKTKEAQ